jgi:hypothetical protein
MPTEKHARKGAVAAADGLKFALKAKSSRTKPTCISSRRS